MQCIKCVLKVENIYASHLQHFLILLLPIVTQKMTARPSSLLETENPQKKYITPTEGALHSMVMARLDMEVIALAQDILVINKVPATKAPQVTKVVPATRGVGMTVHLKGIPREESCTLSPL